ncbi:MAG: hypothetical protein WBP12_03470 [Candidatus Saccharimonas sp.]
MKEYVDRAKVVLRLVTSYIIAHKYKFIVGVVVTLSAILIIALFAYNSKPPLSSVVYQPPRACELFSDADAYKLLGNDVINKVSEPTVSNNTAMSSCSYTDRNPVGDAMKLAAVAVKSGVNDEGVAEVTDDYNAKKAASGAEVVAGFGKDAYFDPARGQLNVLDGRDWYIFSYGVGSAPQANTLEDAAKFARLVLP